jgi:GAF domain-containing protein
MNRPRASRTHAPLAAGEHLDAATRVLLDAARTFSTSLDLEDTLDQVLNLVVPRLADYALVYLRAADGTFRQEASTHVDPAKAPLLVELGRIHQPNLHDPNSHVGSVLTTRRPFLSPVASIAAARRLSSNPDALRIYHELKPVSYVIVPLVAHDDLVGSLVLVSSVSGRTYEEADLELAELVGARAALAIDNARLYREAREARDRSLKAAQLESQLVRARLDALRAQLNPHFLFNALNVVAMLIRRGANEDALRAVVNLSELLRRVLAVGATPEVSLRDEMALIERYLDVEQLRFRDRLSVNIEIEPAAIEARVPGLILQPVVENAIKHGIANAEGPGHVCISARHEGGRLLLRVADNGPGFPNGWDAARSGVGLSNTRERLERTYDGDYRFDVGRGDRGGAVVEIEIPYRRAADGQVSSSN